MMGVDRGVAAGEVGGLGCIPSSRGLRAAVRGTSALSTPAQGGPAVVYKPRTELGGQRLNDAGARVHASPPMPSAASSQIHSGYEFTVP